MKSIERRLQALEAALRPSNPPPVDLFGKKYSSLTEAEKARFWAWECVEDEPIRNMFIFVHANGGKDFVIEDDRAEHKERRTMGRMTPDKQRKRDLEIAQAMHDYFKGGRKNEQ